MNPGEADSLTCFTQGAHRDSDLSGGRGGTIAHPNGSGAGIGGGSHFDETEIWIKHTKGINSFSRCCSRAWLTQKSKGYYVPPLQLC